MRCGACGHWLGRTKRPCPLAESRHWSKRSLGKGRFRRWRLRVLRRIADPIRHRLGWAEMFRKVVTVQSMSDVDEFAQRGELAPWERRLIEEVAAQRRATA